MPAITIAMLVEAITGVATISAHVTNLILEIQSRRKVRAEDVEDLKAQDKQVKAQIDELKHGLSTLANTLDAYISAYFDLMSITTDCERLRMYVKENEADLVKKSTADRVWSNVFWMFKDIQKEARDKYKMVNINRSGLIDPNDLTSIEIYMRDFDTASNQAAMCVENRWSDKLYAYVETMVGESQETSNVLRYRINRILSKAGDTQ